MASCNVGGIIPGGREGVKQEAIPHCASLPGQMTIDAVETALTEWLKEEGHTPRSVTSLVGDVSPRRYFRVTLEAGIVAIAAAYPEPLIPACHRFGKTTELLASAAVRTPKILSTDPQGRFMLLEDLGPTTLFDATLSWPERLPYYRDAVEIVGRIQRLPPKRVAELNPALDRALLERELTQTWEVFLLPRALLPDPGLRRQVEALFAGLCRDLGEAPRVPCHRDFMVRNLVPGGDGTVAVLDHQDLRLGPISYDLASLLNDSLFAPEAVEREILEGAGITDPIPYRKAAVQRAFKAVGTFAAFALRGSTRRLPLIPGTLEQGLRQLEQLPEGHDLASPLRQALHTELPDG
jgi:aminoglycoside/choline kinase family phosphotransferase